MTPGLISEKVVAGKLSMVRQMLEGVAKLPLASEEEFVADPLRLAAGESFLRRALEALLDLGRHIPARGFGDVVPEYAAIGPMLAKRAVVSDEMGSRLRTMGGYRNRLVHGYAEIGGSELFRVLTVDIADVAGAADAVRLWLANHPERLDRSL